LTEKAYWIRHRWQKRCGHGWQTWVLQPKPLAKKEPAKNNTGQSPVFHINTMQRSGKIHHMGYWIVYRYKIPLFFYCFYR